MYTFVGKKFYQYAISFLCACKQKGVAQDVYCLGSAFISLLFKQKEMIKKAGFSARLEIF